MKFNIQYKKHIYKDLRKIKNAKLDIKLKELINIIQNNPYQTPPYYEKLFGEYENYFSRRINYKHRLVYYVDEINNTVIIVSVWSHYYYEKMPK